MLSWFITPGVIAAVKEILGPDAVWIPECSVHRNRYIGWHKDTSIQARSGLQSHETDNTPIIQCAIYFQANDALTGGGLTLIRGSHKTPDHFSPMLTENLAERVGYKLLKTLGLSAFNKADRHPQKEDVLSVMGDVVLFDVRTDHCATQPHPNAPKNTDKLAIFNTFGVDSPAFRDYFQFMKGRPEPYYQYHRETPLPQAVRDRGETLGIPVWY